MVSLFKINICFFWGVYYFSCFAIRLEIPSKKPSCIPWDFRRFGGSFGRSFGRSFGWIFSESFGRNIASNFFASLGMIGAFAACWSENLQHDY